jgi:hypothetical protein
MNSMKRGVLVINLLLVLIVLTGCSGKLDAEETAKKLTIDLNSKDYKSVYSIMVPEYKELVSEEDFSLAMEDGESGFNYIYVKTIVSGDKANAVLKISLGIVDSEMPLTLKKTKEGWRVDAFGKKVINSCRVNGGTCRTECLITDYILDTLECSGDMNCCQPLEAEVLVDLLKECKKDSDCADIMPSYFSKHHKCNLDNNKCEPVYTEVEIINYEEFESYCIVPMRGKNCEKAYDIIYNSGNPSESYPTTVSRNCNYKLNYFAGGPGYFWDLDICNEGYLYYVDNKK